MVMFWLVACESTPEKPAETPASEPTAAVEDSTVQDSRQQIYTSIEQKLNQYYRDLSREQIEVSNYYAPRVEKFFSQSDISRDQVSTSITNGFKSVEGRKITLDPSSLEVNQEGENYVATFAGQVTFTRTSDKTQVSERFRNRILFNPDLLITQYESLGTEQEKKEAPSSQRTLTNTLSDQENTFDTALSKFLKAWNNGTGQMADGFIHPRKGFVYITRPGAMDAVYQGESFAAVFKEAYTPWVPGLMAKATCAPVYEALPEFDCENFSKEGCFVAKTDSYNRASYLMQVLTESDLGRFSKQMQNEVEALEKMITYQVVITDQSLSMCWGKENGKWYLLVLDIATFDCSA